ncbi:MAG: PKD domain-containing protein, partial [Nanoarchaeota archaeon]
MRKQYVFLFSVTLVIFLFLVSCKNSAEVNIEEKQACFKKCMLVEEDKAYCLDDCDMKEKDLEKIAKELCGDNICQPGEKQNNLCPQDCNICSADADCAEKQICKDNKCTAVECTEDSHCDDGYTCENNVCIEEKEELDTAAVEDLQTEIEALSEDIDALVKNIIALQTSLDAVDVGDDDKETIQEDIDVLDTVISQLKAYNRTILGYADELGDVKKNADIEEIGTTFDTAKEEIEVYIEEQQTEVEAIEEAINDLEPEAYPDLMVEDLDVDSVDGNDVTFNITFKNDDDGNITSADSFRIKITSYEDDNSTEVEDAKTTFTDGIEADEEEMVELEVEMEHDPEEYFASNSDAEKLIVLFIVEVDIDDSINESDETNNQESFSITFDRDDYYSNADPTASITASATSVLVDEEISFSGTSSSDSDGSISSYSWDFGDSYSSTSSAPTHSYTTAGSYTVTLTVTDNDGATDS